jgi:hypothetical protein
MILYNMNIHPLVHKSRSLDSVLNQFNSDHILQSISLRSVVVVVVVVVVIIIIIILNSQ